MTPVFLPQFRHLSSVPVRFDSVSTFSKPFLLFPYCLTVILFSNPLSFNSYFSFLFLFFVSSFQRFSRQAGGSAVNGYRPLASRRYSSRKGVIVEGTPLTPYYFASRPHILQHFDFNSGTFDLDSETSNTIPELRPLSWNWTAITEPNVQLRRFRLSSGIFITSYFVI